MPLSLTLLALTAAPLAPSGPWTVYAENSYCMLTRPYGTGLDQVQLGFQPAVGDGPLTMTLLSAARTGGQEVGEARVTRQPDGRKFVGRYYSTTAPGTKQRLTQVWLSGEAFVDLDRTASLRIRTRPVDVTVAVGKFEKGKDMFRRCEDDLLQSWDIRPAAFRDGTRPSPKRNPADYFRYYDYPPSALVKGFIGHVRAALVVGADGQVKDCRVVTRIGDAFDKVTCEQARKIPFAPGLDEKGQPARSLYQLSVRWALG